MIINEISIGFPQFVLILDDLHLISNPQILKIVDSLVDHQPENLHLIIATRADPSIPLSRLRARNQLTEIREADYHRGTVALSNPPGERDPLK